MKNLLSIAMLLLFCVLTANAQTEKGTFSLGLRNFAPGLGYDLFKTKNESILFGTNYTFEGTSGGVVFDIGFSAFF
jgi:hypothetical protein